MYGNIINDITIIMIWNYDTQFPISGTYFFDGVSAGIIDIMGYIDEGWPPDSGLTSVCSV